MAAITVCSHFGTQENKVCHCFHCFPIYLHEVSGNSKGFKNSVLGTRDKDQTHSSYCITILQLENRGCDKATDLERRMKSLWWQVGGRTGSGVDRRSQIYWLLILLQLLSSGTTALGFYFQGSWEREPL